MKGYGDLVEVVVLPLFVYLGDFVGVLFFVCDDDLIRPFHQSKDSRPLQYYFLEMVTLVVVNWPLL